MTSNPENQLTATCLMRAAADGDQQASHDLLPLVYSQLRAIVPLSEIGELVFKDRI